MLENELLSALNDQIKHELYSAYLYLAMSAHFEAANLPGMAHWVREQAKEEQEHAMRLFDHIVDRGGKVSLQAIDTPPAEFGSALDVFVQVYEHEQKVTSLIHNLYRLAVTTGDYASQVMLQWFVNEQVEEEKNASALVEQLRMVGSHTGSLLMLDHALGSR